MQQRDAEILLMLKNSKNPHLAILAALKRIEADILASMQMAIPIDMPMYVRGEPGQQGEQGLPGLQGLQGEPGPKGERGERGDKGERGAQGERGTQGLQGERGLQGAKGLRGERGLQGPKGERGLQGPRGDKGEAGKNGKDANQDVLLKQLIAYFDTQPVVHLSKRRSDSGSTGYQATTSGTVDGSNTTFVFATAPSVVSVDGIPLQKTQSDGTVNWTGTTTITLSRAPNFDVYAIS